MQGYVCLQHAQPKAKSDRHRPSHQAHRASDNPPTLLSPQTMVLLYVHAVNTGKRLENKKLCDNHEAITGDVNQSNLATICPIAS
jgi:hypothetical protein